MFVGYGYDVDEGAQQSLDAWLTEPQQSYGPTQMTGAPFDPTQPSQEEDPYTPVQPRRSTRTVHPPDPWTYSERQVRKR